MSKSTAYVRVIAALASYPRGEAAVKAHRQWPQSKTRRVTCADRRPNEAEWLRRLALS